MFGVQGLPKPSTSQNELEIFGESLGSDYVFVGESAGETGPLV